MKRDHAAGLVLVTGLLNTKRFSTANILNLYSLHWTMETAFQHVTKEFDLRHMIGSTAEATLSQFANSLVIYKVMRLIQAHVSQDREISPEDLSLRKVARTTRKQLSCLTVLVPAGQAADQIQSRKQSAAQVSRRLSRLWDQDWMKEKKRTTKTPHKNNPEPIRPSTAK